MFSKIFTSVAIMQKGQMVINGRIDEVSARVMGATVLIIDVLDGQDVFHNIVRADSRAGEIERTNATTFQFRFSGDSHAASELLAHLIRSEVRVAAFSPKREGLEDVFLKVGAREVS